MNVVDQSRRTGKRGNCDTNGCIDRLHALKRVWIYDLKVVELQQGLWFENLPSQSHDTSSVSLARFHRASRTLQRSKQCGR